MKETINAIGTLITIIALVMALVIGGTLLRIFSGIALVYVMYFHDEVLKVIWEKEKTESPPPKKESTE